MGLWTITPFLIFEHLPEGTLCIDAGTGTVVGFGGTGAVVGFGG